MEYGVKSFSELFSNCQELVSISSCWLSQRTISPLYRKGFIDCSHFENICSNCIYPFVKVGYFHVFVDKCYWTVIANHILQSEKDNTLQQLGNIYCPAWLKRVFSLHPTSLNISVKMKRYSWIGPKHLSYILQTVALNMYLLCGGVAGQAILP